MTWPVNQNPALYLKEQFSKQINFLISEPHFVPNLYETNKTRATDLQKYPAIVLKAMRLYFKSFEVVR